MVSADDFVSGASVRWKELATTLLGGWILVFFGLWTEFYTRVGDVIEVVLGGFADEAVRFVDSTTAVLSAALWMSYQQATAALTGAGPASYVLAVGLVLAVAFAVGWFVRWLVARIPGIRSVVGDG